jgi:hypothetical protein
MTHVESVRTGAAAVRRISRKNPMEVLAQLRAGNPTADFQYQFVKWRELVERDDECHEAAMLHAFRNLWTSLDRDAAKETPQRRAEREARAREEIEKAKQKIVYRLLDFALPNGKLLRNCTGKECKEAGGWLTAVAAKVKPNEIVGKVLSEEKLRALYRL